MQTAHAADFGLSVAGGSAGDDYSYEGGVLTIKSEAPLTVSLAEDATADRIVVDPGKGRTARLTLDDVRIDASALEEAALLVESGGLDLVLAGDNSLKSGGRHAGLENGVRPLVISGDGKLLAQGPAAGIGGGYGDGSNITIKNGEVVANGGCAGIGGGYDGSGTYITIEGGTIVANGGCAGIGGGYDGDGTNITISGGEVAATGGIRSAGIGGGEAFIDVDNPGAAGGIGSGIVVEGGFITATPGEGAQAIGSGSGAATREDPSLTGGFFADAARDWAGNRVYGVAPARGFAAAENRDAATSAAYPVRVLPMAALGLAAEARRAYDGSAPAASEVVEAARYGAADALGSVELEHRAAGAASWEPGLPAAAGTYRVRASLPEKEVGGARYAAATAEGGLVIAPAAFSYRVDDQKVLVGSRLSDVAAPPAATGVDGEAVEGALSWYADADCSAPLSGDWAFPGEAGATAALYWRFAPDASEANYAPGPVSGRTAFLLVARPPEDAPSDPPADTPGEKPADPPAGKPTEKPTDAPAPKPLPGSDGSSGGALAGTGDPLGPLVLAALASVAVAGAVLRRAHRR